MLRDDDSVYDMNSLMDSQSLLGSSRRQSSTSRNRLRTNSMNKPNAVHAPDQMPVPEIAIQADSDTEEQNQRAHEETDDLIPNGNGTITHEQPKNGDVPRKPNGILRNKLLDNVMQESMPQKAGVPATTSCPHGIYTISPPSPTSEEVQKDKEMTALVMDANDVRQKSRSDHDVWSVQPRLRKKGNSRPEGVTKMDYMRPLYRKDIFYSGSIRHIPQFQSNPDVKVRHTMSPDQHTILIICNAIKFVFLNFYMKIRLRVNVIHVHCSSHSHRPMLLASRVFLAQFLLRRRVTFGDAVVSLKLPKTS